MGGRVRLMLLAALALALTLPGRSNALAQVGTILSIQPAAGVYGGSVRIVATLKDADTDAGIPNKQINFLVNGQFLSAATDASGQAVLSAAPLGRLASGAYAAGLQARFDGEYGSTVYEASAAEAVLTVAKRPLRVVPDPATREYGDPNPAAFAYRLEDFAFGEDAGVLTSLPTCTTTADQSSDAGTYPILCAGLEGENYVGDYSAQASLTVTSAPMAIVADDQFRLYGQGNPAFTAAYLGAWKLGQGPGSLQGTLKCNAPGGTLRWSSAGKYEILCTGQTALNYALKYVPGTLQIGPAPQRGNLPR